jgi:hypothetical protein
MNFSALYETIKTQWIDGSADDIFFITSEPGIGKSALAKALGADPELGFDHVIDLNPSLLDTPDLAGIYLLGDEADYLKSKHNEQLYRCRDGKNLIIWEEVPDSNIAMQNLVARWAYDRNVNGLSLSDKTFHLMLGNRSKDKSGAGRVSTKLNNRTCNLTMDASLVDWVDNFALPNNVDPLGIQFLRYREPLFCKFDPDAEMGINPTPRSWTRAFRTSRRLDDLKYFEKIKGEVGEGPAAEFTAFRKIYMNLVSFEEVVMDPTGIKIPEDLSALYATVGHTSYNTNTGNVERVAQFIDRLPQDFQTMYWQDSLKRTSGLKGTKAFIKWASNAGNALFN